MNFVRVVLIATIFWLAQLPILNSQTLSPSESLGDEMSIANAHLSRGEYITALPLFLKLWDKYPQDPSVRYGLGVCYLNIGVDIERSRDHLLFASTRDVPNMVYYYLGEYYRITYQFDEAISYYRRFTLNGGSPEISRQHIEQRLSQCENGKFMLRYIFQPEVLETKVIPLSQLRLYTSTQTERGDFVTKPSTLKTRVDVAQGDTSQIFFPHNPKPGERVFFSSWGNSTSFGRDIYMIELMPGGLWSKPVELGRIVNTSMDEDFPFMAADGVTLYFASKGHYSMGGYDLYKSVFNPSTGTWGAVENLGFPISSTSNDLLLLPNDEMTLATIVTQRGSAPDSARIVVVRTVDNPVRRAITSLETITQIASLAPQPQQQQAIRPPSDARLQATTQPLLPKVASFRDVENDPEYIRVLAKGFEQQMRSDSMRIQLQRLRQAFDNITTAQERRQLEAQVIPVENGLIEAQNRADAYFAQASHIEQEYITGKRKPAASAPKSTGAKRIDFLYQAEFAHTVFHSDEISRLARLEGTAPQIDILRRSLRETQQRLALLSNDSPDRASVSSALHNLQARFVNLASPSILGKKKIYADCISVALVKRGAVDHQVIRAEVEKANQHFRNAAIIRNNATEESRVQSEYEALTLDELGVLRLELAFAKLWGIRHFEQQRLSQIYQFEQNIFGRTLEPLVALADNAPEQVRREPEPPQPIIRAQNVEKPISIEFQAAQDTAFIVLERTLYSESRPIPLHLPIPDGVVYKIQLGAFSRAPSLSHFRGIYPLWAEPVNNGMVTKYYAGLFRNFTKANDALLVIRSMGFKDAFIAAWHNGRSVAPTRAQSLESDTIRTPNVQKVSIQLQGAESIFVIQIGPYASRLPDDISQTVRALAPGKDLSRKPDGQGGFLFSISSYPSLDEANRVRDNLVASGIRTAEVVPIDIEKN